MDLLNKPILARDPDYKKKILLLDLETTPLITYNWGLWQQDAIEVKEEWYILCFAYKYMGEKTTYVVSLPDFRGYAKDKTNDFKLVEKLWKLLDETSIVIAHNGDGFDLKKSNARFIFHGLEPPSPYQTIDTLKLARKYFKFDSNKLDYLGQYFKIGRKLPHTGKHLWLGCMAGDQKSWDIMTAYNKKDVELLEKVYLKLRGWSKSRNPNLNLVLGKNGVCSKCGSEHIHKKGPDFDGISVYQRLKCMNCGANIRGEKERTEHPYV